MNPQCASLINLHQVKHFHKVQYTGSHHKCSIKKCVLRYLAKSQKKHLCYSLFFNKVVGVKPATLLKKRLWHSWFPVSFVKFLKKSFYRTPLDDRIRTSATCWLSFFSWPFLFVDAYSFHHCTFTTTHKQFQ